jgi:hypothetical protein
MEFIHFVLVALRSGAASLSTRCLSSFVVIGFVRMYYACKQKTSCCEYCVLQRNRRLHTPKSRSSRRGGSRRSRSSGSFSKRYPIRSETVFTSRKRAHSLHLRGSLQIPVRFMPWVLVGTSSTEAEAIVADKPLGTFLARLRYVLFVVWTVGKH